ncbi:DEAD/DEAH box helicase [Variovorax sp. J22G21]|uniref:DEAD/DEAH box helicase n=1 Tax=Variovorax fucosicus TaxID=3053517 RepID=UPI00257714FA|nr:MULTISPECIES: DEAD/DEAH box helicase [unclassified Variovorax]MDM0040328.1 DEAD/DEAH box helicase [Variovorax sp. J22R193]MDM0061701.1 DEAD/DEAH box helicase [Variovorax sp. J22G21]
MTDAFEAQGEFAPVQSSSDEFVAIAESNSDITLLDTLDVAAAPADVPKAPNGFIRLGLAPELIAAVADLGFDQPTTVQDKVIPLAMTSNDDGTSRYIDLMVSSQTGSGKTAAFLLPVLHTLLKQEAEAEAAAKAEFARLSAEAAARGEALPKKAKRKDPTNTRNFKAATPGALILCPTRELAQQVAHDAIDLVRHCRGLRVASVVGGMPYQLQIAKLQNANLVVATPGRLLDLQRSMQIKLDQVQFLVVDEADRMLDLGFSDDLAEVNQLTIERKQTMMFSATFAPRIQQLASRVMRQPQKVQIDSPQEKHANIKQSLFWADNTQHKRKMLDHWLRDTTINQAIVFASTQVECDGLANDLQQEGFSAVALHGALSQGLRNRRLMALRQGDVQILVATDVAARGIDVPTITHVFNFGLPMKAEDYTHRIGRTGRAGRDGLAITFAEFRDRRKIMDIEHYSHQNFKAETIPGLEPQQRMPQSRPQGNFGGGRDREPREFQSRDRKFGGGTGGGHRAGPSGGYAGASGFNDRGARPAGGAPAPRGYAGNNAGFGGGRDRDEGSFGRKPGWGDNAAPRGGRNEGFGGGAPRGNAGGGKVFVPRDAKPRAFKPTR